MFGRRAAQTIAVALGSLTLVTGSAAQIAELTDAPAAIAAPDHVQPVEPNAHVQVLATQFVRKPARKTVKPVAKKRHVVKHKARHLTPGPTSWSELNAAIARIPSYRSGVARWVVADSGYWATADWYTGVVSVSRRTPTDKLYAVVVHEWSHLLSVRSYGGDVHAAAEAMRSYFGSTMGPEYAADCMALLQGATWTHYTSCSSSRWRAGARRLLAGKHLT
jgi:hypothetical protein